MENILKNSLEIISVMEKEKISVREFMRQNSEFFEPVMTSSLIAPECRNSDIYKESGYIFLIGSYIYFKSEGKPVTWFERRRFAKFEESRFEKVFRKTLCSNAVRRFGYLKELKESIKSLC